MLNKRRQSLTLGYSREKFLGNAFLGDRHISIAGIQSRLKIISILPLNLGQTLSLLSLCQFLATQRR
ncbi:hypothetical protein [uncultured Nostoc sp.]|uniref:hypothetical protein n=1 Tax=uncultured Nostoc sp. TaxID=340711 RepID=UPI0026287E9B|nr:hypothetical protein [uncultured Nostoc sp.]